MPSTSFPAPAARRPSGETIVFVHSSDDHYGADRILLDLVAALPALRRERAEVWLPTDLPHGTDPLCSRLRAAGVRVRHLDLPVLRRAYRTPGGLLALAARAARLWVELARTRPRLVYCTTSAMLPLAPLARACGARVLGHVQEFWRGADRRLLAPLARCCHRLIAISPAVAADLPAALTARTAVVTNATRTPAGERSELAEHTGELRFVMASRWNAWKGHRTLLAAWEAADLDGELVVLGDAPPAGEKVDVRALATALRRPESVTILGDVPDVAEHLEAADVVLVPSEQPEPFGLVAVEAFARGRPVIAADHGGLHDIVRHQETGWLFTPGDVSGLAALLRGLDRPRVVAAGARAREAHRRDFSPDRFARQWLAALDDTDPELSPADGPSPAPHDAAPRPGVLR